MQYTYSFEKLQVWVEAKELTKHVYKITKKFPSDERFGLISQLRRASISIASILQKVFLEIQIKTKLDS